METQHTETVVEKAVAYVKDMLGMPPDDKAPDVVSKPEYTYVAPELISDEAMRLDPQAYAFNKIVERSRRVDAQEHANSGADEHMRVAGQLDRAKELVHQALDEIQDISRGIRERIIEEKNPDAADRMRVGKDMPSESEIDEAVEVAKAADRNEEALSAAKERANEVRSWR